MRFIIHYEINGIEDALYLEGETIKEIQDKAEEEKKKRGLDTEKNNMWSEKIEA